MPTASLERVAAGEAGGAPPQLKAVPLAGLVNSPNLQQGTNEPQSCTNPQHAGENLGLEPLELGVAHGPMEGSFQHTTEVLLKLNPSYI